MKPIPMEAGSKERCSRGCGVAQGEKPWETELADSHQLEGHIPSSSVICTRIKARSSRLHCMNPAMATLTSLAILVAHRSEQSPQGEEKRQENTLAAPWG